MKKCCLLAVLLLAAAPCLAQTYEPPPDHPTLLPPAPDWFATLGAKYDSEIGLLASFGLYVEILDPDMQTTDHNFWVTQLEIGEDGGKIQFGVGKWMEDRTVGGALKLSLMQTWGNPEDLEPDQAYLGLEYQFNFHLLNMSAGAYVHIGGNQYDHDETFIMWSGGVGF